MQAQEILERYQTGQRDFTHLDLSGASLSGANLRDADLSGANLSGANLSWAFLSRAKLTGANLRRADLRNASLNSAILDDANLSGADLSKADLRLAQLPNAELNWAVLQEADLSGANLQFAKLDQANLERAKLNSTCLTSAELMEANLRRASLSSANLDRANLREAHLEEANLRETSLVGANLIEANLSGVYLRQANLSEADLHRAILMGADLSEANLSNADLSRSNLSGAYLLKTNLHKAHLLRANLQDTYLLRADLNEVNLRGADLRRADLSGAYLSDATLSEADLSDATLLESHLIRTNLEDTQMTGCCIYNWHIEDLDLTKANCRYVYTQFNYTTKKPTDRYPADRDLEPGELGRQYQEESSVVEVQFREPPHWEALVFTLTQVGQEGHELNLTLKSYEPAEDSHLVRLTTNRLVNGKLIAQRISQLYPEILRRFLVQRSAILKLLDITPPVSKANTFDPIAKPKVADRRQRIYQEVVRQIQYILLSQPPEQFVESVQNLLNYLTQEGIPTEDIQKRLISQAITQRAKQNPGFRDNLSLWDKNATETARLSAVGQAVRLAIVLAWSESKPS